MSSHETSDQPAGLVLIQSDAEGNRKEIVFGDLPDDQKFDSLGDLALQQSNMIQDLQNRIQSFQRVVQQHELFIHGFRMLLSSLKPKVSDFRNALAKGPVSEEEATAFFEEVVKPDYKKHQERVFEEYRAKMAELQEQARKMAEQSAASEIIDPNTGQPATREPRLIVPES